MGQGKIKFEKVLKSVWSNVSDKTSHNDSIVIVTDDNLIYTQGTHIGASKNLNSNNTIFFTEPSTGTSQVKTKQLIDVGNNPVYPMTTAANATYTNSGLTSVNNVKGALDALYDMINWTALTITNVTINPTTTQYQVGTNIPSLKFTWKTSKTPSSTPTVTGNTNGSTNTVTYTESTGVYECTLTNQIKTSQTSLTYTINAPYTNKDGKGTTNATSSKTISWKYNVFWGYTLTANINNITYADKTGEFLYDASKTITNIAINPGCSFWIAVQKGYKVTGIKNLDTNADETVHTRASELTYTLPNNSTAQYKIYYVYADGNFTSNKGFQITFAAA